MKILLSKALEMIKMYEKNIEWTEKIEANFTVKIKEKPRYRMKIILKLIDTELDDEDDGGLT